MDANSADQTTLGRRALGRAALGVGLAAALPAGAAYAQKRGGTLTVALPYDSDTLNPYATGFLGDVQACVLEGLLAPNEKAEYIPVLAMDVPTVENGLIKIAPDGKDHDHHLPSSPRREMA